MKCKRCNQEINPGEKFCGNCGCEVQENANKKKYMVGGVAFVLALILCFKIFGGSGSYETPFYDFKDAMNTGDAEKLKNCFIKEMVTGTELRDLTNDDMKENGDVKITTVDVVESKQEYTKSDWDAIISDYTDGNIRSASAYSDIAIVNATYVATFNGETDSKTFEDILVVKEKGKWYIADPDFL